MNFDNLAAGLFHLQSRRFRQRHRRA